MLKSIKDNGYYIGYTSKTLEERLACHNKGSVKSTKFRRPLLVIYFEEYPDSQKALKREWHLKHAAGYQEKLLIIEKCKAATHHLIGLF